MYIFVYINIYTFFFLIFVCFIIIKGLGRGGRGIVGKGRGGGKVKGFGSSGVEGTTGVDVAVGTARGLDTPVIWTIAAGCAAFVALAAVALYYRKRLLASVKSLNA